MVYTNASRYQETNAIHYTEWVLHPESHYSRDLVGHQGVDIHGSSDHVYFCKLIYPIVLSGLIYRHRHWLIYL